MKILVAPDSFKGSMTSVEASESIARGIISAYPDIRVKKLPLSDGGEGLVDCLVKATGGNMLSKTVTGPLGNPVVAPWGILGDNKTAVIEMASASGLLLLPEEKRDPRFTTTYGTGELIKAALDKKCINIILGLGGSATNDGGSGMVQALGAELLNRDGEPIPFGGSALAELDKIDTGNLDPRIEAVTFQVACDVDNPLTGEKGASVVFGPQKGATPEMVTELDRALSHYAEIIKRDLNRDVEHMPGAGAAGGVGAGVVAFLNGKLTSGIDLVLEAVGLEKELTDCDLIISGEGKFDAQSAYGKVPVGVARLAKKFQVPVIILAGSVYKITEQLHEKGITACFSIINEPMPLEVAMTRGSELLEFTAGQLLRLFAAPDRPNR